MSECFTLVLMKEVKISMIRRLVELNEKQSIAALRKDYEESSLELSGI